MLLTTPPADASALRSSPGCSVSLSGDAQGLPCFTSTRWDRHGMAQIACHAFITRRVRLRRAPRTPSSQADFSTASAVTQRSKLRCELRQLPRVGPEQEQEQEPMTSLVHTVECLAKPPN